MRTFILGCLLLALVPAAGTGEEVHWPNAGGWRSAPLGSGLPRVAPIPPVGGPNSRPTSRGPHFHRHPQPFPFGVLPYYTPAINYAPPYQPPQQPTIVVVQAPQTPEKHSATAEREPPRSELIEYDWAEERRDTSGEAKYFTIVLKDGSEHSAQLVWNDERQVCYVAPDGRHCSIPLALIHRERTIAANRAQGLRLALPPEDE